MKEVGTVKPEELINEISNYVFTSKYARYNSKKKRRETWTEAVDRLEAMHLKKYHYLNQKDKDEIVWAFDMVRQKLVAPSMRSLQFGGKAIEAHSARIYNCCVRQIDSIRAFAEIFYLLLCGCGAGLGLTKKYVNRLPLLVDKYDKSGTIITYVVEDSIEGWANSIDALLQCYFKGTAYSGRKIVFDYSKIRKKGTPIKTGGGKAPGYEGLKQSLNKVKKHLDYIIEVKHQDRLKPVDAYDILMHISDAVLSGGIRRSATIAIFSRDDDNMMNAKVNFKVDRFGGFAKNEKSKNQKEQWEGWVKYKGEKVDVELNDWSYENLKTTGELSWLKLEPQRARSNNSVLLIRGKVSFEEFKACVERTQKWGEPGFIWADSEDALYNPCVEIGFIPLLEGLSGVQFCNLTTQNGSLITSLATFKKTARAASIIGTLQAGYTDFPYLSVVAKQLTEDEALLGVSITGMMDNPDVLLNAENQRIAAKIAVETNQEWAEKIGIKAAARVTCIKPEGTSSLVLGSGSGIHGQHDYEFWRRVQANKEDNVYQHFAKFNPHVIEPSVWSATKTDDVIAFPITIPPKALVKKKLSALKHLEYIKSTQQNWVVTGKSSSNTKQVEHNVSCTVIVKPDEWEDVIRYVYDNRKHFCAVSMLPASGDKDYPQAPMEAIVTEEDKKRFIDALANWKKVDYTSLKEEEDETEVQQTLACAGGVCELVT